MPQTTDKSMVKVSFKYLVLFLVFFLSSNCSNWSPYRLPSSDPASLDDLVQVLKEGVSEDRKAELMIVRDNLAKFFLYGSNKTQDEKKEIFNQAQKYFQFQVMRFLENVEDEEQGIAFKDMNQFKHPPTWTLKDEIDFMNKQANEFEEVFSPREIDMAMKIFKNVNVNELPEGFDELPHQEQMGKAMAIWQKNKNKSSALAIMDSFEEVFVPYIGRIRNVGEEFANSNQIQLGNEQYTRFIKDFLNHYYQNVDEDVVKTILSELINLGKEPTEDEIIQVMFNNSGPGLGKTLQQLGKEPEMGDKIKPIMEMLESDGKKVPIHLVEELTQEDGGFKFYSISEDPLGTGTIAQVHRAEIKRQGKKQVVALRFLKPGVEGRADQDIEILKGFINQLKDDPAFEGQRLPNFEKIIDATKDFLFLDLDIDGTIRRQTQAFDIYERSIRVNVDGVEKLVEVKVPKVYKARKKGSRLHVQEFVQHGVKFDDVSNPQVQKAISRSMFRLWFEEALFRSGFMHADLHQGNFTVLINETEDKAKVFIFDYGMSTNLNPETQKGFIMLGAGVEFKDSALIAKGIQAANGEQPPLSNKELKMMIKAEMPKMKKAGAEEWIAWAVKVGALENDQLGTLARGGMLISQLPRLVGEEDLILKELQSISSKELFRSMADRSVYFPLSTMDKLFMGQSMIKSSCSKLIRGVFRN